MTFLLEVLQCCFGRVYTFVLNRITLGLIIVPASCSTAGKLPLSILRVHQLQHYPFSEEGKMERIPKSCKVRWKQ